MELLLFLNVKRKDVVKLARKSHQILFYRAAFFSFGKVRELVGEIKYAFDTDQWQTEIFQLYFKWHNQRTYPQPVLGNMWAVRPLDHATI